MFCLRLTTQTIRSPSGTIHPVENSPRTLKNLLLHVRKFQHEKKFEYSTCGIEKLDKCGDEVPQHIHFHFNDPSYTDGTIKDPKRNFQDWWRKQNLGLKGNKVWSLTYKAEPDDWNRLFRYPLKETPYKQLCNVPPDFNLENESKIAQAERLDSQKRNKAYYQKKHCKETLADRIFNYLAKELKDEITYKNVWKLILQFYLEEKKPICFKTIEGYTINWLVRYEWITKETAYALNAQNKNITLMHNGISPKQSLPCKSLEKETMEPEKQEA